VLHIKCDNSMCLATTDVHTGKRTPNGSYCINSKVAIGMKIFKEVFMWVESDFKAPNVVNFVNSYKVSYLVQFICNQIN
jgi:hypothetical protein